MLGSSSSAACRLSTLGTRLSLTATCRHAYPLDVQGRIDVIVVGTYDPATQILPYIIRNNRRRTADKIDVGASVLSRSGALLDTPSSTGALFPTVLRPGEIAFGYLDVNREDVPAGADSSSRLSGSGSRDPAVGSTCHEHGTRRWTRGWNHSERRERDRFEPDRRRSVVHHKSGRHRAIPRR